MIIQRLLLNRRRVLVRPAQSRETRRRLGGRRRASPFSCHLTGIRRRLAFPFDNPLGDGPGLGDIRDEGVIRDAPERRKSPRRLTSQDIIDTPPQLRVPVRQMRRR